MSTSSKVLAAVVLLPLLACSSPTDPSGLEVVDTVPDRSRGRIRLRVSRNLTGESPSESNQGMCLLEILRLQGSPRSVHGIGQPLNDPAAGITIEVLTLGTDAAGQYADVRVTLAP